jgi:hypothetical protein
MLFNYKNWHSLELRKLQFKKKQTNKQPEKLAKWSLAFSGITKKIY